MLKRIHKEYKDKGLSVICLNTQDNFTGIRYAIRKDTIPYPVYSIKNDEMHSMGITGAPAFILLDINKKIHYIDVGYVEGYYNILSKEIDKMLAKKE